MSAPPPSEFPSGPTRRLRTCYLCTRPPRQVFGHADMVDLEREGRVYACARHPLVLDHNAPDWAYCGVVAFCHEQATMGLRGAVPDGRLFWVVFACDNPEHALHGFDLVPVDLR